MTRFDLEKSLRFLDVDDTGPGTSGWPRGAQAGEYRRSPVARQVGRLAAEAGLFAFHFEHRHRLPLPESWCAGRSQGDVRWVNGVLPESKYQSFRHEHAVASFHPGHRAKWGTHELCHALVGFAWSPTATPLFHATAARLSELLPVALWYFLDEARLTRCARHAAGGALFRELCLDCEAAAGPWGALETTSVWMERGLLFVEQELRAVQATRRTGRPVPHRWATLNLCSDGLAYADAHGDRLRSASFAMWIERFAVDGAGWQSSLDGLIERVLDVCSGLTTGDAVPALVEDAEQGRDRWLRQDVGARLLQVWEDCDGDGADALLAVVDQLAGGAPLVDVIAEYEALHEDWIVPDPRKLFAVGYPLPEGLGSDLEQLARGIESALPQTAQALGSDLGEYVRAFAARDPWTREGIGRRFAKWLATAGPDEHVAIAHYEAAITHARSTRVTESRLLGTGSGPHRLTAGVQVLRLDTRPDGQPGRLDALVAKEGDNVLLVELSEADAQALAQSAAVPPALVDELSALGLAAPTSWPI